MSDTETTPAPLAEIQPTTTTRAASEPPSFSFGQPAELFARSTKKLPKKDFGPLTPIVSVTHPLPPKPAQSSPIANTPTRSKRTRSKRPKAPRATTIAPAIPTSAPPPTDLTSRVSSLLIGTSGDQSAQRNRPDDRFSSSIVLLLAELVEQRKQKAPKSSIVRTTSTKEPRVKNKRHPHIETPLIRLGPLTAAPGYGKHTLQIQQGLAPLNTSIAQGDRTPAPATARF